MNENPITRVIEIVGLQPLAHACGVTSYQAVRKWEKNGLPRTEWTGETNYAKRLAELSQGQVTEAELLAWSQRKRRERQKKAA